MELHKLAPLALAVLVSLPTVADNYINPKPFVIPELTSWQGGEGGLLPSHRIIVEQNTLTDAAQALADDYATMFGPTMTITKGKATTGDIVFRLVKGEAAQSLGEEGYTLRIDDTVTIEAATPRGAYWGTRTLLQISEQSTSHSLPCGTTTDLPAYPIRGFMMDCGRKYIPLDYLDRLVKVMSYYKMNTLQVHLNDNGFKQYFNDDWELTQGAFRLESNFFPGLAAADGHYTKQDFIRFQHDAAHQHVDIIPEIDVPAHCLAFSHYRPSLGSKEYGMDHLDLKNPEIVPFLDSLFTEYCGGKDPVFRGKRVHIGTDEYSNRDPEVVELFRGLTDHLIRKVESLGKQAIGWGALTHADGKTPVKQENVILDIWYNGYADPLKMKEDGYQLISIPDGYVYIVPAAGYYYDYLNCEWLYNNWTPAQIGEVKLEERDPQLLGGMFAVWNDHCGNGITVADIHHRLMPAMQTLSTLCWGADMEKMPWAHFDRQRQLLSEAPGVNDLHRPFPYGVRSEAVHPADTIRGGAIIDWLTDEIGYDYTVSFDLKVDEVKAGTILFDGPSSRLYLAAPESGRLAFEREGYLNEFDYFVVPGRTVNIKITGNNRETSLWINGRHYQTLGPITTSTALKDHGLAGVTNEAPGKKKMYYQRTLIFPLQRTGDFIGTITHLTVSNYIK